MTSIGAVPEPWPGGPPAAAVAPPLSLSFPAGAEDIAIRLADAMAVLDPALVLLFGTPAGGMAALGGGSAPASGHGLPGRRLFLGR